MKMREMKADKVGFEPTIRLPVYSISNAAPSTARTPVQWKEHYSEEVRNAVLGAGMPQGGGWNWSYCLAAGCIKATTGSTTALGTPHEFSNWLKI